MNTSSVSIQPSAANVGALVLHRGLRIYSQLVCAAVALLIFVGALVTSHDAGLAVPDWPTTYGENMFLYPPSKWVGPIFYEHFHRLLASGIGLLTIILTVWVLKVEKRRWVRMLTLTALAAVIVQGLLGGLTVLLKLPDAVSVAHGMLAQTFFCLTIVIAYSQSQELRARLSSAQATGSPQLFRWALVALGAVYLQLFFGAVMRHGGGGIAVPDFPTTAGAIFPHLNQAMLETVNELRRQVHLAPATMYQVVTHCIHRFWAYVVVAALLIFAWKTRGPSASSAIRSVGTLIGVGIVLQFTLGALTVLSVRQPYLTSAHVAVGALMLGLCVLAVLRAFPVKSAKR